MKIVIGILTVFVTMPIWFFLLYRILEAVNASELMWFLYCAYVPTSILVGVLTKAIEEK